MDLAHVADLWEENQEYLKQRLGESAFERYGAHWVLMPDAPFPRFNHVSRIRVEPDTVADLLADSEVFFRAHRIPINSLMVTPATEPVDLGARLQMLGYGCETNPVMIWDETPIEHVNEALRIERAGPEDARLVFDLIRRVFFPNSSPDGLAMARRGVDISYKLGAINYIAYWGRWPAGAGMLFSHGGMGGIYNMCTLPEFRGRGVATAILAACLDDAQRSGCEYVGLTPTTMGRPLYEKLGFREVYQERYYVQRFY